MIICRTTLNDDSGFGMMLRILSQKIRAVGKGENLAGNVGLEV